MKRNFCFWGTSKYKLDGHGVSPHTHQAKKNKYPKMIILKTYLRNTARIFIFGSIGGWNMAGSNDNKVNQISLFQST
ncbi:hypothetical protein, partial [Bacillus wiedmannii]|uniref:hypothetical protein n=1 Tax=Bacillus wiedmannii TaxID=1890302 RepID=UPI001CB94E6E